MELTLEGPGHSLLLRLFLLLFFIDPFLLAILQRAEPLASETTSSKGVFAFKRAWSRQAWELLTLAMLCLGICDFWGVTLFGTCAVSAIVEVVVVVAVAVFLLLHILLLLRRV